MNKNIVKNPTKSKVTGPIKSKAESRLLRIGLVGTNGAGKSEASRYFRDQGFYQISLSDMVREAAKQAGLPADRMTLMKVGTSLKANEGMNVLAQRAIVAAKDHPAVVIDSIRHPSEVTLLSEFGAICIGIDAPVELRYNRIVKRKLETDSVTFEEFVQQEAIEMTGKSAGQNLGAALSLCHYIVSNDSDKATLYANLQGILDTISQ